jgi:hypothetical protein
MASNAKTKDAQSRSDGVPRTHSHAKRLGFKSLDINFEDLDEHLKQSFVRLSDVGSRSGSICGFGPSSDPRHWMVCYKDPSGQCQWVEVPKTSTLGHP